MPFRHFHKHYRKYMVFAAAAMFFGLFTFNIPQAIQALTGNPLGAQGKSYIRFKTLRGRDVEVSYNDWISAQHEMPGFVTLYNNLVAMGGRFGGEEPIY